MNINYAKMDSTFDEIYALLVTNYLFPGFADSMKKWESPDWKNEDDTFSLEVTRAQNSHIGYTNNVMAKYLGQFQNQIPPKILQSFRGWTCFKDGKLLAISDSKGLVDGARHIYFLLDHLDNKLKKLNASHFTSCCHNYLFEFSEGCFSDYDKQQFSDAIQKLSSSYPRTFDKIIASAYDNVLYFLSDGTCFEDNVPTQEFTRLAILYRKSSNWQKGTSYSEIRKHLLK